ncbi:SCO2583/SCO2584 N-terminal domain-containing protein [Kitasatospora sp. NPDC001660]
MPIAEDPEPRPSEGGEPGGSAPSGAGGKDPFADLVLDDEFVRSATVKEQSGRTRMLTARWKHTPPVDPGGRRSVNDGPAAPKRRFGRRPKLQVVDPWGNPRPPKRRGGLEWRTPLFVLLTIVVLLAALNIDGLRNWYHGDDSGTARPVPTVAPETAKPTAAPSTAAKQQPTVDHPWVGSPSEGWPTSMASFEPKGTQGAIGVFSAEQVAAQVKLVKDYLAAANMDPKVIAGARPDAALALLSRESQDLLNTALANPSKEHDPTLWFARFDPREAIQIGDTVKVQGLITVEGDGDKGVLVHTDFTYVYALRPGPDAAKRAMTPRPTAGAPQPTKPAAPQDGTAKPVGLLVPADDVAGDTWTTRTVVRKQEDFRFYDPARYHVNPAKLMVDKSATDIGNSACDVYDGLLHPQFDQFASPDPDPTGPQSDPYDRSRDLPTSGDGKCGTVSRY